MTRLHHYAAGGQILEGRFEPQNAAGVMRPAITLASGRTCWLDPATDVYDICQPDRHAVWERGQLAMRPPEPMHLLDEDADDLAIERVTAAVAVYVWLDHHEPDRAGG